MTKGLATVEASTAKNGNNRLRKGNRPRGRREKSAVISI